MNSEMNHHLMMIHFIYFNSLISLFLDSNIRTSHFMKAFDRETLEVFQTF